MKTIQMQKPVIALLAASLLLSACGKTKRFEPQVSGNTSVTGVTVPSPGSPPVTPTPPSTPTGVAPYSYEFSKLGYETYTTGTITTDNVLKVKFQVTAEQGNSVHKASELKVTLVVNGHEVTPTYTSSNYVYGQVGETSNVIDLSSYITPGVPATITVKLPANDFYCTYAPTPFYYFDYTTYTYEPVNPLYGSYPGCRKAVFAGTGSGHTGAHTWSGVILVQTSATDSI